MESEKVKCGICSSPECILEVRENGVEYRICLECGYMTSSEYKIDSPKVDEYEKTTSRLIKEMRRKDKDLNQYWYLSVVNVPGDSVIFPVGNPKDWRWGFAKMVSIPVFERHGFPILDENNNPTGKYHESRLGVENSKYFVSFKDAFAMLQGKDDKKQFVF